MVNILYNGSVNLDSAYPWCGFALVYLILAVIPAASQPIDVSLNISKVRKIKASNSIVSTSTKETAYSAKLSEKEKSNWWNPKLPYRVRIKVNANGYKRVYKPVEVDLDFTKFLDSLSADDALLNEESIRVVEINNKGRST